MRNEKEIPLGQFLAHNTARVSPARFSPSMHRAWSKAIKEWKNIWRWLSRAERCLQHNLPSSVLFPSHPLMMAVEYSIGVTNRFGALNFDDEDLEDFQPKKEKIKVKEESHEDRPKKQDKKTAKQQSKETKPASTKKDFVNEDSRRGGTYVKDLFSPCNVECTCFCTVTPSCCQTTCVLFILSIYPCLVLYLYCL